MSTTRSSADGARTSFLASQTRPCVKLLPRRSVQLALARDPSRTRIPRCPSAWYRVCDQGALPEGGRRWKLSGSSHPITHVPFCSLLKSLLRCPAQIRVESSTDIVFLNELRDVEGLEWKNPFFKPSQLPSTLTADQYKTQGNTQLAKGWLMPAERSYTDGLKIKPDNVPIRLNGRKPVSRCSCTGPPFKMPSTSSTSIDRRTRLLCLRRPLPRSNCRGLGPAVGRC